MTPKKQTEIILDQTKSELEPTGFAGELQTILDRELSPENIDSYVDRALTDLIDLDERILDAYHRQPTISAEQPIDNEVKAFQYFGVDGINNILDHLADTARGMKSIDTIIEGAVQNNTVIVPPNGVKRPLRDVPSGEWIEPHLLPRLKTVLFILSNEFDIDIRPQAQQVSVEEGVVTPTMMRKHSYFAVDIPSLDRTVLVCDEVGNATFVLNTTELANQYGISAQDVLNIDKVQLDAIIDADATLGRKVIYSNDTYVPQLVEALGHEAGANYLYPKASEDILSAHGLELLWGISRDTIAKTADALENQELVAGKKYRFHNSVAKGYTQEEQALIYDHLAEKGVFNDVTEIDETIDSGRSLGRKFGVSKHTALQIARSLVAEGSIETPDNYKYGAALAPGHRSEAVAKIQIRMAEQGLFLPFAPEDILSVSGMADGWGVSNQIVKRAIKQLQLESVSLESDDYRFGVSGAIGQGYSVSSQALIYKKLEALGAFIEDAPEDYMSLSMYARSRGSGNNTGQLKNAIEDLKDQLGVIKEHRYSGNVADSFSPGQRAMIDAYLATTYVPHRRRG